MDDLERPRAVTAFIWIWSIVTVVGLLITLGLASEMRGADVGIAIGGHVINIAFIVLCAQRRNWARIVLAVLFGLGVIYFFIIIGPVFRYSTSLGLINLISEIAGGVGVWLLFTRDATDWFLTRPVDERTPEQIAAARRSWRIFGIGTGAVAAVVVAWLIIDPDFTDWEPIRASCLGEDPQASDRERRDACTQIIESERFEAQDLFAIHMARAELYRAAERWISARSDYADAAEIDGTSLEAWRGAGEMALRNNRFREAIEALDHAVELAPDDIDARAYRGEALIFQSRLVSAVEDLEMVVAARPDEVDYLHMLGFSLRRLGRLDEAVAAFDAALALTPDDMGILADHAWALIRIGRPLDAVPEVEQVLEQMPRAGDMIVLNVVAHCRGTGADEARAAFDAMVEASPRYHEIWVSWLKDFGYGDGSATGDAAGVEPLLQQWFADQCPLPEIDAWL